MTFGGSPWPVAERSRLLPEVRGGLGRLARNTRMVLSPMIRTKECRNAARFCTLDSPAIKRLMLKMLYPSPDRRISIQDAISDRWVKTVDCCSVEDYGTKENAIDAAGRKLQAGK
jgi:hypothetical protein